MSKPVLAIALCRVSSIEQLQNDSLRHQKVNVLKAAEELGATIPADGVWEGQVSSKKGVNFNRKDLLQMVEYCKRHSTVKYLIVQEVDRFMRSPDEQTYWYVRFKHELDVLVWFADKPELNKDTHEASLLRYLDGWRAGGSNEERIKKSISGQTAALKDGRWPFCPKPGYRKGYERGIPEIHPARGPALQNVLLRLLGGQTTPQQALAELNSSAFMKGHSTYKMDKFRNIVIDPFYAGIVQMDKQVKVRNENGLHEPLITKEQHYALLKIMDRKRKSQNGPLKNGNPQFPCNNFTICDKCLLKRNGRFVGFNHTNGKPNSTKTYQKYRCRACGRYISRDDLHNGARKQFKDNPVTNFAREELIKALNVVWQRNEDQAEQEVNRIKHQISALRLSIAQHVEAATDPANASIRTEILTAIETKKAQVTALEEKVESIHEALKSNQEQFLRYAYAFIEDMSVKFLDEKTSKENRLRCKQLIFPAGFYINTDKKVYTPEKSILITLLPKKKSAVALDNSQLVRVRGL